MSSTGKTYDEYREIIKQLKFKVKKQQTEINELREENSKYKTMSVTNFQQQFTNTLQNTKKQENLEEDERCVHEIYRIFQKIGFNLEMLYRCIDSQNKGVISVDEFKTFLNKLKILELTSSKIMRFLYAMDETFSGSIKKDDYMMTLKAYNVNEEAYEDSSLVLQQKILAQFIQMHKGQKAEAIFKAIDGSGKNAFSPNQLADYLKKFTHISKRQKVALFHAFDIEMKGFVTQDQFKKQFQAALASNLDLNLNTNLGSSTNHRISLSGKDGEINRMNILANIKRKFRQQTGFPLTKILEGVAITIKNPERGILLNDLSDAIECFGKNILNKQETFALFKSIDVNRNGSVYFDDLRSFFVDKSILEEDSSYRFLIINFARELQAQKQQTQSYLYSKQINEDDVFDLTAFTKIITNVFDVFPEHSEKLFKAFIEGLNLGNSKTFTGKEIQILTDSYRFDSDIKPEILKKYFEKKHVDQKQDVNSKQGAQKQDEKPKQARQKFKANMDAAEEQKLTDEYLEKILTHYKMKDKLREYQFKNQDGKVWETILQNKDTKTYIAVMNKCNQIVKQLAKGQNYIDPEWGGVGRVKDMDEEKKNQSLQSMYFYNNTIPSGCPENEDVTWKRLSEIVDEGKKAKFFDEDGANASDVNQSSYLGNCWFVSALSIVAGCRDELLKGKFINDRVDRDIDDKDVKDMTSGVYPPIFHIYAQFGLYVFRFFKNNQWTYVIVDDYLPCLSNGDLIYGKCKPPEDCVQPVEFWVSMIEKAYAKLHNCYQALFSGYIDEALLDLTGFASEKRQLNPKQLEDVKKQNELWKILNNFQQWGCMIGCSATGGTEHNILIDGQDTGLLSGHAYAVINIFEIDRKKDDIKDPSVESDQYGPDSNKIRLLRIRNPWGYGEWKLKWSEEDSGGPAENEEEIDPNEKNAHLKRYLKEIKQFFADLKVQRLKENKDFEEFNAFADDGFFLMQFEDWFQIFTNIFISLDFPDYWSGKQVYDGWKKGQHGGFPMKQTDQEKLDYVQNSNKYLMKINRPNNQVTNVFLQVGQNDGRTMRGLKYPFQEVTLPINCIIWKAEGDDLKKFEVSQTVQHTGKLKIAREICIPMFSIPNGNYVIVPSTKDKDADGNYFLKIYFDTEEEKFIQLSKVGSNMQFDVIAEESEHVEDFIDELEDLFELKMRHI